MIALPFVGIDVLLVVLWFIAFCLLIAVILGYISGVLSGLPFPLNKLAGPVESLAHGLTSLSTRVFRGTESLVGAGLHWVARKLEAGLNQFVAHAAVLERLAAEVAGGIYSVSGLRALVHGLQHAFRGIEAGIRGLTRAWHGIEHRVKALERAIASGIGHDLRIEIKALEREWHGFKTKELPAIEADVGALGSDVATAERWVAKNFVSDAELATEATAAAILAAAGVSWLRCNSNPFNNNRNACGLWGDLANLLAIAAIDAATLASLYELIGIAQQVTPTVTGLASDLLKV